MTPLSDSEAATVARFENAEPAPESWDGGLREQIRLQIRAAGGARPHAGELADAVLALPEIAALRAKADAADRVRALAEEIARSGDPSSRRYYAARIRRALDGPPPC